MSISQPIEKKRTRASSSKSLTTKSRVFDAAEKVFGEKGFDGATIRDIAAEAGEPVGTIHHHGGGKAMLFHRTVARRADTLSRDRLAALAALEVSGDVTLEGIIRAFILPFFDLVVKDFRWRNYARLVALVSADSRWRDISADCFDPAAKVFIAEIAKALPERSQEDVVEAFIFSVSAILALLTSSERMSYLGAGAELDGRQVEHLVRFCVAGFRA